MEKKRKILVLCGPTGTGKTGLGIKLAKKFNGEIVSADSRQVYRGMDIGTGKDLPVNSKFKMQNAKLQFKMQNYQIGYYDFESIPVWLLDIIKPDYQFSVADYVKCANLVIENIYKRGKLPIIVGGTGLYIKGLIDGIGTLGLPPDWKLRRRLLNCPIAELLEFLKKLNPKKLESMNNSDRNNPRRLIRAIELSRSDKMLYCTSVLKQKSENLWVGLTASYDELYKRIDQRVEERIKQGMEEEIKKLLENGYTFENSVMRTTIGYKEWILNQIQDDAKTKWKFAEHAYARRQMTWFKKNERIKWFNIMESDAQRKIEKVVDKWYNT